MLFILPENVQSSNPIPIRSHWNSLKTGFLKWKPEYDIAADEYQKAGK